MFKIKREHNYFENVNEREFVLKKCRFKLNSEKSKLENVKMLMIEF